MLAAALLALASCLRPRSPPPQGAWLCCAGGRACGPGDCHLQVVCPDGRVCVRAEGAFFGFASSEACAAACAADVAFPGDRFPLPSTTRCANGFPALRLRRGEAVCGPLPAGEPCASDVDCVSGLCAYSWLWDETRCGRA